MIKLKNGFRYFGILAMMLLALEYTRYDTTLTLGVKHNLEVDKLQKEIADLEFDKRVLTEENKTLNFKVNTQPFHVYSQEGKKSVELPNFTIPEDCIGFLYIPSVSIEANIRYGSTMEAISGGHVGEFECSERLGVGNYSILGHANENKDYVFSNLYNIKHGDCVYIVKNNQVYVFLVDETKVVEPDDVWILDSSDVPIITIMCCINDGNDRFVVNGYLVDVQQIMPTFDEFVD